MEFSDNELLIGNSRVLDTVFYKHMMRLLTDTLIGRTEPTVLERVLFERKL